MDEEELVTRLRESGSRSEVEIHEDREEAADRIEALEVENARLKSELRWYANRANWDSYPTTLNTTVSPARLDGGKRARAALAQIDAEPAEPRQPSVQEAARVLVPWLDEWMTPTSGPFSWKNNKCPHGNYGHEGCEDCLEEAIRALAEGGNQ